ncbi:glycosyltransferase [Danxiaibacter flavus]|uniref:Glycosyltransferase n=1 Tax=Danxiaibacter flavus TaxID=3049108 RepID=A0ABV3Z941_9BACT|nr:glycosyltransferase [Chitinophagaceae bacterium DXS]
MERPGVTVLMPAYNAGCYIAEAIESVLCQTMKNFELLIINDGSTDNTEEVIRSLDDSRITVISQKHKGVAQALNAGLHHAKGEYIARFDADDICFPERLEKQKHFLDVNPDYVITGGDAVYISEMGDYLCHYTCPSHDDEQLKASLLTICPFIHSSVMYRKAVVMLCGGYNELAHNMEDHLLWVQLSRKGKFCNFAEPLIKVRFNPASVTIDERWRGKYFRSLKYDILKKGFITESEGYALWNIIHRQDNQKIKKGAYYALCGKKYLINNHQPKNARVYIKKAIKISPLRLDNYALLVASFFPPALIKWLHQKIN